MKTPRILALYFPNPPSPESLPELATLLLSLSPRVGIRSSDGIYIDLTPTAHLFPSEPAVIARLETFFQKKGIVARIAIADDLSTAALLSRKNPHIIPSGESEKALAPLPIDSLLFLSNPLSLPTPEETKSVTSMIKLFSFLGVSNLGDFARLPSSTITPRFGSFGVDLHRRARGVASLPFRPFEPSVTYREIQALEEPIGMLEPLLFIIKRVLSRLEDQTRKDSSAALKISLFLETEDAQELEIIIPLTRPIRRASGWFGVIREKLSRLEIPAPLISLTIEISIPIRVRGMQFHLFDAAEKQQEPLDELLGRLIAGLGPTVVSAASLRERHRPEKSWEGIPFDPLAKQEKATELSFFPRPTLMVSPPEPLQSQNIVSLQGPERLEGEWWDEGGHARDYFVAQTDGGQLLWIFKDLQKKKLFLHGYFD